jgi:molecular chaperone HscB
MDPFATLGIDARFDVDLAALEKRHREISRALHPDRFAQSGSTERRIALGKSADVNEAWRIVRDPVKRAEALLVRAGIEVGEDREPKASAALLVEVMDLREALAEARERRDVRALEALKLRVEARARACEAGLTTALASPERATEAVPILGELRFHRRFLDEVARAEEALEGGP